MNSKLKELLLILANAADDFDDLSNDSEEDDTEMMAITSAIEMIYNNAPSSNSNTNTEKTKFKSSSKKNIDCYVENHLSHYTDQEFKINLSIHKTLVSYLSSEFEKTDHYLKIIGKFGTLNTYFGTFQASCYCIITSFINVFIVFVCESVSLVAPKRIRSK